jgi:ParB family chromosome partitioning protein
MSETTIQKTPTRRGGEMSAERPAPSRPVERWRIADITIPEGRHVDESWVQGIAASMEEVGQLGAVLVTPAGVLVAGLHRLRACELRGEKWIDVIILDEDDLHTELAGIDENLERRELPALERAELLARRKEVYETLHPETVRPQGGRRPKNGDMAAAFSTDTAGLVGCHPRKIQSDVQIATDIPQDVRDRIRGTQIAGNKTELVRLARHDPETQRRLADRLSNGEAKYLYEAERSQRLDEARERARNISLNGPGCRLVTATAQDLIGEIEPGSVDLILTDPPYGADALPAYDELGRLGAHALTPNGSLLVMVGQMHLIEVLEALSAHLDYRWVLAYLVPSGGSPIVPTVQRKVNSWWKPILWFTRPEYDGECHGDLINSGPKTKTHHEWEQDVAGMARLIELFSVEGQLVGDPFAGTGTTGVAAQRRGRRFIGGDEDADRIILSTGRLHEELTDMAA